MRACSMCGLSVGRTATFCPVCGSLADALVEVPVPARRVAVAAPPQSTTTSHSQAGHNGDGAVASGVAHAAPDGDTPEGSPRLAGIAKSLREASGCEKRDAPRAAEAYRLAIIGYLEAVDDPLGSVEVRKGLLKSFDRLSLVLKKEGLTDEALEQAETAAALGLLECRDPGVKGHREALERRLESLRRAVPSRA